MTASFQSAINAYSNTARFKIDPQGTDGTANQAINITNGFTSSVKETVAKTAEPIRNAEKAVAKSLMKQADISDVVSAVTQAELMLQTIVALRDRLVNVHQEILRMPI